MGERARDANSNPRMRNQGNPHARADTRQPDRSADVAPAQVKAVPPPKFLSSRYRLGSPIRPNSIVFDNGFLDKYKPRKPTAADFLALTQWKFKLEIAEKVRFDLEEACIAYRHFLMAGGLPRSFSYEAYVYNDESGATTLANAMRDIQDGAEIIYEADKTVKQFSLTGDQIPCGSNTLYPYPETENWQKAIGGHVIWLSGNCKVVERGAETWLVLDMVLHAEDRYNFNPGAKDIATDIPDSDNGIFEITGLAKQYTQTAELKRRIEWKYGTLGTGGTSKTTIPWR